MFSPKIVSSDAFLDMPVSTQALYFHLGMHADDDGFVNPRFVMRMAGASEDDLKVLLSKRFVLHFENGVIVIKHWRINNQIKSDRYQPTIYNEQMLRLAIKENGSYTEKDKETSQRFQNGSTLEPQVRLGKVSIGKVSIGNNILPVETAQRDSPNDIENAGREVNAIIELFKTTNPSYAILYKRISERKAVERLLKLHGREKLEKVIAVLPQSNTENYAPTITTPVQLENKYAQLEAFWVKRKRGGAKVIEV